MRTMRLASAAAAGLLLLAAGCRTAPAPARADRATLERAMAVHRGARAAPAGLVLVVAVYCAGEKGPALRIAEARRLAADPPLLQDAPGLDGRIELLDASGRVVWSMGYAPPPGSAPSAEAGSASGGEVRLLLRAPDHSAARSVRLRDRGAVAEAPLARPE
jgi:hypothetical protein